MPKNGAQVVADESPVITVENREPSDSQSAQIPRKHSTTRPKKRQHRLGLGLNDSRKGER